LTTAVAVLAASALVQLVLTPFRTSVAGATFRLAVIDSTGKPAGRRRLLARWTIVWLPLFLPLAIVAWLAGSFTAPALFALSAVLLLWIGAAGYSIAHPARGLPDRIAGTWVVRR
jgi:hypothetical protein